MLGGGSLVFGLLTGASIGLPFLVVGLCVLAVTYMRARGAALVVTAGAVAGAGAATLLVSSLLGSDSRDLLMPLRLGAAGFAALGLLLFVMARRRSPE